MMRAGRAYVILSLKHRHCALWSEKIILWKQFPLKNYSHHCNDLQKKRNITKDTDDDAEVGLCSFCGMHEIVSKL